MNPSIELCFNVRGGTMPVDNGYPLYAALSSTLGQHLPENVGVIPFHTKVKVGNVFVFQHGLLRIRTPNEHIGYLCQLTGKTINVQNHECQIGSPLVFTINPSTTLYSPFVNFKNSMKEDKFLENVQERLDKMGIKANASIPLNKRKLPQRKIRVIRGVKIVGFGLKLENIALEDANSLLHTGLGGRRHMGGGIFFPVKEN